MSAIAGPTEAPEGHPRVPAAAGTGRRLRLQVEYVHQLDPADWQRRHAAGLVPNRLPYGLHHLERHGFELRLRPAMTSFVGQRVLGGVARRLSGGFEYVDALRDLGRRSCDIALCWDERTGVPAALRSRLRGEPPAAMQTIWLGDPGSRVQGARRTLALTALKRAVAVWANTEHQLQVLAEWGIPRSRLHLVHTPGIDDEFWRPSGAEPDGDRVLAVGMDRHRDHPFVVESLGRLRRRRPVRLDVVTPLPVEVPPELGERHPFLRHDELRGLYGRASVVAVGLRPNLHVSGATAILESMACARPVVVTRQPGVDQYVSDGETGLLVEHGDADAFAAAVGSLLDDPERARALGLAGRARLEQRFSSRALAARLAEILHAAV